MARTTTSTERSSRSSACRSASWNSPPGQLVARVGEHPRRRVDADDGVAGDARYSGVAAGPRGVESDADGQGVEDLPHDRLLDLEQLVELVVVHRRPAVVALRVEIGTASVSAERVRCVEQRSDLAEPRTRELAVVLAANARSRAMPSEPMRYASGC